MNISSFDQERSRVVGGIFLPPSRYQWRRYGVAVLAVAIALLVKLLLNSVIDQESPFLIFFAAVLVSSRYGGMGAGVLATFLAALLSDYFFLSPTYSFIHSNLGQNLQLFLFVVEGISVSSIVASLNSANQRVQLSKLEDLDHEESLHQCEERFCLLVEDVKDYAIFMINTNGYIASWNAGGKHIFGYLESEIIGQELSCIFTLEDIQSGKPKKELQTAMALGQAYEEGHHVRQDGTSFWASGVITALRDEAGNMRGFSKVVRDITERKQAEEMLQVANDELEVEVERRTTELRNANKYLQSEIAERQRIETALQKEQEFLKTLLNNIEAGIVGCDSQGFLTLFNQSTRKFHNSSEQPLTADQWAQHYDLYLPDGKTPMKKEDIPLFRALQGEHISNLEMMIVPKHGVGRTLLASGQALFDPQGKKLGAVVVMNDITERLRADKALRQSEDRLRIALQLNQANTWDWDMVTNQITWCNNHELLFGLSSGTFDGTYQAVLERIHPEDRHLVIQEVTRAIESRIDYDQEYRVVWFDGSIHWLAVKGKVFYDRTDQAVQMIGLSVDITAQKRTAKQIAASLKEKEVLLKEIHHRVKNNLQIVSSLLNLQAGYLEDQKTIEILKQCENRVGAMALIHEQLYQSHDLAKIEFAEYVKTLTANLLGSYDIRSDMVALKLDIDNIFLSVDAAIPCGLIVNELVSNSLKYAFPSGKKGEICIGLHADNNNQITLSVSDDGIGFSKNLYFRNTESLGLQIVIALTSQLEGTIELDRNKGTKFEIKFY